MLYPSTLRTCRRRDSWRPRVAVASPAVRAADQRPISEFDLFRFTWIADPQMSPDGAQVAFVRVDVNEKKDGYDTSLWIVADGWRQRAAQADRRSARHVAALVAGRQDAGVRARALKKADDPQPGQVFVLSMSGGEARRLTKLARGAGNPDLVAGRQDDRLHQHQLREGSPRSPRLRRHCSGRYFRSGRRAGAPHQRRARHHARDLSRQRRRLSRSRRARPRSGRSRSTRRSPEAPSRRR